MAQKNSSPLQGRGIHWFSRFHPGFLTSHNAKLYECSNYAGTL